MTTSTNTRTRTRKIIGLALVGLALLVALLLAPSIADAHPPDPKACVIAWQQAPAGSKWTARQRCLAAQLRHRCQTHPRLVPATARVKGQRVDREQRRVIGWLVQTGVARNLPRVFVLSAIATTTQEASAREIGYGHGTSVGPFQLISDHGTAAQRETIEFSGNWFYSGAWKSYRRGMGPVELSHAVQRSRYPTAVAKWIPEANRTLIATLGSCRLR